MKNNYNFQPSLCLEKGLKLNMKILKITDLKEMLNKTEKLYENRPAYKIREEEQKYKIITHQQLREMVNALGTQLIELGLSGKRIAIIGENR